MTDRRLDAPGKGEYTYDYVNDILLFKIKNRRYEQSVEFDNFVVDIDEEQFITGIQIFDASKLLRINKYALRKVTKFEFQARLEGNIVTVQIHFSCTLRNKEIIKQGQDFQRETPDLVAERPMLSSATA